MSQRVISESLADPTTQVLLPQKNNAVQIDRLLPGQRVIIQYSVFVDAGQAYVGVKNLLYPRNNIHKPINSAMMKVMMLKVVCPTASNMMEPRKRPVDTMAHGMR